MKQLLLLFTFLVGMNIQAQFLDAGTKSELVTLASSIGVNEQYGNGDWSSVLKEIDGKRIVLIGEFSHGARELFLVRNDLIKALYEQQGFDVILFESGIGEMIAMNLEKAERSPTQLTYGFFGIWRTKEFDDLMAFVKEKDIEISGYDVQRSGTLFQQLLEIEASKLAIDSILFKNLGDRFIAEDGLLTDSKVVFDSVEPSVSRLMDDYKVLLDKFEATSEENREETTKYIIRTLENRIYFLGYSLAFKKTNDWTVRWEARDAMMSKNIEWLIENFYSNKKIIVVGHNYHLARFNEKEEVMGEFLQKKYGSEMYAIGMFAGAGVFADNYGREMEMKAPSEEKLDIKHIIAALRERVNFLSLPKKTTKANSWMFENIIVNDSFIDLYNSNELNLSKNFDGLLFIDHVSLPIKE